MIDIHTHIIPGIDDGAEDLEDAILMAELAVESGVQTIIATPHCNIPGSVDNYWGIDLLNHYQGLQREIRKRAIPLELLIGMEIFATDDVPQKIMNKQLISLNNSGYYLIEFGFYLHGSEMTELLQKIKRTGAIPVIAHPERYMCVQNRPQIVVDWLDMGCQLQINKGSVFGKFGRNSYYVANELLQNDCVTYIASDAHSPYRRTTYMKELQDYITAEYSAGMAQRLLIENPERYLLSRR